MLIDKGLCKKILEELSELYPGVANQEVYKKITEGQTDGRFVAAHFQYLEEKSLIETAIYADYDEKPPTFEINLYKTKITALGLEALKTGI